MATKKDLEDVIDSRIDEIAARVNRVLGDYNADGQAGRPEQGRPEVGRGLHPPDS